jgi:O-antigen/teichoic acid export membrane protein
MFFVIQVAGLLVLQTDNLVIAHYLGASAVTPYSVTWRLFTCTTLLQSVLVQAIWPAYTEAFARGDSRWIKRTLRMNLLINGLTTGTLVAVLVATGPMIILAWAGPAAVPPFRVVLYMGIWSLISAVLAPLICLLNARGRLKGQMIYGIMLAIANRILSVYLLQRSGIEGVILGTVLAYSIFAVVPLSIECAIVLKELSTSPRRQL